jgi:hypothetical protein
MPTATRHELIFAHNGSARVAASVTLAGVVAVLLGGVSMAIGPRLPQDAARNGTGHEAKDVRVIGTSASQSLPCDEQVWPNFDQRCLVRTNVSAAAPDKPAAQHAARNAKEFKETKETKTENSKLSPLGATGDAVVGKAVTPEDEAIVARQAMPRTRQARADDDVSFTYDDTDGEDAPPPRPRHVHRHFRFPFHGHIGPFHF